MTQMNRSHFLKLSSFGAMALGTALTFITPALVMAATEAAEHGAAAAEHAEHADAVASPFAGTIYQSIAAVIVFVLLYLVLSKLAFGPILKGLKDREDKIKADLHRAEDAAIASEKSLKEYQAQLATARVESQKIIDNARLNAEKLSHQIQEQAQKDIDAAKARATAEITFAKETALRDIFSQTASLATDVASKILRREIKVEDQQILVSESLASLRRENLQ